MKISWKAGMSTKVAQLTTIAREATAAYAE